MTSHSGLSPDGCSDVVEVAMEFHDLVVTAAGTIDDSCLIDVERRTCGESAHGLVQALDPPRHERMQADPQPHHGQEDSDDADAELTKQTLTIDGLRQAEIVNEQNQRTACRAQLARP